MVPVDGTAIEGDNGRFTATWRCTRCGAVGEVPFLRCYRAEGWTLWIGPPFSLIVFDDPGPMIYAADPATGILRAWVPVVLPRPKSLRRPTAMVLAELLRSRAPWD